MLAGTTAFSGGVTTINSSVDSVHGFERRHVRWSVLQFSYTILFFVTLAHGRPDMMGNLGWYRYRCGPPVFRRETPLMSAGIDLTRGMLSRAAWVRTHRVGEWCENSLEKIQEIYNDAWKTFSRIARIPCVDCK